MYAIVFEDKIAGYVPTIKRCKLLGERVGVLEKIGVYESSKARWMWDKRIFKTLEEALRYLGWDEEQYRESENTV